MADENKIRDAADAVKGILEVVPVYQDVLQPAAQEVGKGLQTVSKVVHIALAPVSLVVWGYEQIKDYLHETLTEKLKEVPPDQIVQPKMVIAGPIVEQLRFAADEPSLRELYANLLATSMDARTAREAHPAFVEIVRQMNQDEARILFYMSKSKPVPVFPILSGVVRIQGEGMTHIYDFGRVCSLGQNAGCLYPALIRNYLDNLLRLRLVEILPTKEHSRGASLPYHDLERGAREKAMNSVLEDLRKRGENNPSLRFLQGTNIKEYMQFTDFGRQFCRACVDQGEHTPNDVK